MNKKTDSRVLLYLLLGLGIVILAMFLAVMDQSKNPFAPNSRAWEFWNSYKPYIKMFFWGAGGYVALKMAIFYWKRLRKNYAAIGFAITAIMAFGEAVRAFMPGYDAWFEYLDIGFLICFVLYFIDNRVEKQKHPNRKYKMELIQRGLTASENRSLEYMSFINDNPDVDKICLFCDFAQIGLKGRICKLDNMAKNFNNRCDRFKVRSWER